MSVLLSLPSAHARRGWFDCPAGGPRNRAGPVRRTTTRKQHCLPPYSPLQLDIARAETCPSATFGENVDDSQRTSALVELNLASVMVISTVPPADRPAIARL